MKLGFDNHLDGQIAANTNALDAQDQREAALAEFKEYVCGNLARGHDCGGLKFDDLFIYYIAGHAKGVAAKMLFRFALRGEHNDFELKVGTPTLPQALFILLGNLDHQHSTALECVRDFVELPENQAAIEKAFIFMREENAISAAA
ncbi:hypothetical protein [Enterovibrio sp. 27052020O]|uniref:hypothetical protein n=1 Tax=Enterovibrio sp. 27052020O TaxID=3241166 RepID=UPI00388DB88A